MVAQHQRLLTESEAAHELMLRPATLRRWRWSGKGPTHRKIGGAVRYHPDDLTTFIDSSARQSTSAHGTEAE